MSLWLYACAGSIGADALIVIALTGKPRKPVTPAAAVITVLFAVFWVTVLVIIAGRIR